MTVRIWITAVCLLMIGGAGLVTFVGCGSEGAKATTTDNASKSVAQNGIGAAEEDKGRAESKQPETQGTETQQAETKTVPTGPAKFIDWDALSLDLPIDIQAARLEFFLRQKPEPKQLDGQRIRIGGYIYGGVSKERNLKEFVLIKNTNCKYGPGGKADCLIVVKLKPGVTANYSDGILYVEGVLRFKPEGEGGFTYSVYNLEGEAVSKRRRL